MNNTERDAAIDDLLRRVEVLESATREPSVSDPTPSTETGEAISSAESTLASNSGE